MVKLNSCSWVFADKWFAKPTKEYRDNYDRIFGKNEETKEEDEASVSKEACEKCGKPIRMVKKNGIYDVECGCGGY